MTDILTGLSPLPRAGRQGTWTSGPGYAIMPFHMYFEQTFPGLPTWRRRVWDRAEEHTTRMHV